MKKRLLFASIHSYLDPSSGAALGTRELLELLAARSWDSRALTCGVLDYAQETPLDDVLCTLERPTPRVGRRSRAAARPRSLIWSWMAFVSHCCLRTTAAASVLLTRAKPICSSI